MTKSVICFICFLSAAAAAPTDQAEPAAQEPIRRLEPLDNQANSAAPEAPKHLEAELGAAAQDSQASEAKQASQTEAAAEEPARRLEATLEAEPAATGSATVEPFPEKMPTAITDCIRAKGSALNACPQIDGNPDLKNPEFCAAACTEAIQKATTALDGSCCSLGGLPALQEENCKKATSVADAMIIASYSATCGPLELKLMQHSQDKAQANKPFAFHTAGESDQAELAAAAKAGKAGLASLQTNEAQAIKPIGNQPWVFHTGGHSSQAELDAAAKAQGDAAARRLQSANLEAEPAANADPASFAMPAQIQECLRAKGSVLKACPQVDGNPDMKSPLFCAAACSEAVQQATTVSKDGSCCTLGGLNAEQQDMCKKATSMADALIVASYVGTCGPMALKPEEPASPAGQAKQADQKPWAFHTAGQSDAAARRLQDGTLAAMPAASAKAEEKASFVMPAEIQQCIRAKGSVLNTCPQLDGKPDMKSPLFCAAACTEAIQQATSALDGHCCDLGGLDAKNKETCQQTVALADALIVGAHTDTCGPVLLLEEQLKELKADNEDRANKAIQAERDAAAKAAAAQASPTMPEAMPEDRRLQNELVAVPATGLSDPAVKGAGVGVAAGAAISALGMVASNYMKTQKNLASGGIMEGGAAPLLQQV